MPMPTTLPRVTCTAAAAAGRRYEVTDRCVQGLSALFLALRRRPVIRYQRGSEATRRLADSLYNLTYRQQVGVLCAWHVMWGSPP